MSINIAQFVGLVCFIMSSENLTTIFPTLPDPYLIIF
jgi:hypothetical protein